MEADSTTSTNLICSDEVKNFFVQKLPIGYEIDADGVTDSMRLLVKCIVNRMTLANGLTEFLIPSHIYFSRHMLKKFQKELRLEENDDMVVTFDQSVFGIESILDTLMHVVNNGRYQLTMEYHEFSIRFPQPCIYVNQLNLSGDYEKVNTLDTLKLKFTLDFDELDCIFFDELDDGVHRSVKVQQLDVFISQADKYHEMFVMEY